MTISTVKYLLELDFVDKSDWSPGDWHSEPDKVHWIDADTGLPCLILRGPHGALNGYVGVQVYHPAYGLSYDGETQRDRDAYHEVLRKIIKENPFQAIDRTYELPEKAVVPGIGEKIREISVHGGLTFSGPSQIPTRDIWTQAKETIPYRETEAKTFPHGDSAEWLKIWGPSINDYDAWSRNYIAKCICIGLHDEETWWFGFDCAHAFDLCPKTEASLRQIGHVPLSCTHEHDVYRNLAYVENECRELAKQLKELACYK